MINEDKDFITVYTKTGETIDAELVSKFTIEGFGEYVIYKIDDMYYGARYEVDGDTTKLITDLTDFEKDAMNEAFSKLEVE